MKTVNYGEIVKYSKDKPIRFSDFTLKFVGKRIYTVTKLGNLSIIHYDFKIENNIDSKIISWSQGTGDIGATYFTIKDKILGSIEFALYMAIYPQDPPLRLAENELVIVRIIK